MITLRRSIMMACLVLPLTLGCGSLLLAGGTYHQRCGWKAEAYFTDPQVVALCHAIEVTDLAEMDRLVKAGADVNARGKGKMTPLLWAYPDNKLPRFKWLLEHGADPNVVIESDFNTGGIMNAGDSVTLIACRTTLPGYFDAVFDNGGDPNIRHTGPHGFSQTPLVAVIKRPVDDKPKKVARLIELGADMNALAAGGTPVMDAVGWGGQYDLALIMLEAGAEYRTYQENGSRRLIHSMVLEERSFRYYTPEQMAGFHKVVQWLEDHGESYEEAKADLKRWDSWSRTNGEFRRKMDAEIADRKAREKAAASKAPAPTPVTQPEEP